jgi:hypothetical protein
MSLANLINIENSITKKIGGSNPETDNKLINQLESAQPAVTEQQSIQTPIEKPNIGMLPSSINITVTAKFMRNDLIQSIERLITTIEILKSLTPNKTDIINRSNKKKGGTTMFGYYDDNSQDPAYRDPLAAPSANVAPLAAPSANAAPPAAPPANGDPLVAPANGAPTGNDPFANHQANIANYTANAQSVYNQTQQNYDAIISQSKDFMDKTLAQGQDNIKALIARMDEVEKTMNANLDGMKIQIDTLKDNLKALDENASNYKENTDKAIEQFNKSAENMKANVEPILVQFKSQKKSIEELLSKLKDESAKANKSLDLLKSEADILNKQIDINNEIVTLKKNLEILLEKKFELNQKKINSIVVKGGNLTPDEYLYAEYISKSFIKNSLHIFIDSCKALDAIPSWRAKLSGLIVTYLKKYLEDPNNPSKHINMMPSYEFFNIVLMGSPGVGKSYTAEQVGKALKGSGLLTVGNLKDIKKPDIIGAYVGQTAPKVYAALTDGLGKVVFIDEAYSIAGPKDKSTNTFNQYGQEAIDAITDYTSEHIGLFSFVAAGYEWEMKNQFIDVNVGMPRRFPTQLILRRYDMKSYWKILKNYITSFCPIESVNKHHYACFQILNLMFNYQVEPNPTIKLSKFGSFWERRNYIPPSIELNLSIIDSIKIPILNLADFKTKIDSNTEITSRDISVEPYSNYFKDSDNNIVKTFIKAYILYAFTTSPSKEKLLNGDLFRNQADNLTKFGQIMLENFIMNNYDITSINEQVRNMRWIESCYFRLYFEENPNRKINNLKYSFGNNNIISTEEKLGIRSSNIIDIRTISNLKPVSREQRANAFNIDESALIDKEIKGMSAEDNKPLAAEQLDTEPLDTEPLAAEQLDAE